MPQCKDCKHFKPLNKSKGDCFGHEVVSTMNADKCPAKAFTPR